MKARGPRKSASAIVMTRIFAVCELVHDQPRLIPSRKSSRYRDAPRSPMSKIIILADGPITASPHDTISVQLVEPAGVVRIGWPSHTDRGAIGQLHRGGGAHHEAAG